MSQPSPQLLHPTELEAAVALIADAYERARRRDPAHPRVLVALAGRPGGGKTTAAGAVAAAAARRTGARACVMAMDGYHLYRRELDAMPNRQEAYDRRGAEWTFSPERLLRDLRALRGAAGREVRVPTFDHAAKDPAEGGAAVPGDAAIVVVEGNYVLYAGTPAWAAVAACFDVRLFLHCPRAVTIERLCRRHMAAWGITRAQALVRAAGSDTTNGDLVDTTQANAEYILHSIDADPAAKL